MTENTLYECTVCGRIGSVGRCCGDETRRPLNNAARAEIETCHAEAATLYMQLKAAEVQLFETHKALKMLYQWVQAEVEQFEAAAPDDFIIEAIKTAIKKAEEVAE